MIKGKGNNLYQSQLNKFLGNRKPRLIFPVYLLQAFKKAKCFLEGRPLLYAALSSFARSGNDKNNKL